ncbi:hypothetical protein AGABI1DRAFT_93854 [Agaricus bisporus var. burnettii JB137-S8]|uniref:Uncharacterized protein n=1 Tax=Agaricus bisporus var. burnettii (strain JB137-S8 / ATCC MYA-4627 / FGSC 10392) TaxID=597362 RepID=K5XQ89_AGABU|nr:uncharacterized protein AGABI1DRAFT_93854 [Agaricus bisporus var. burnettii JB137-S8]EKM76945.1 hypothetical protein AGABI1DRAFT_93854 [Agaricus bisporus var. burnettii JB137-S8]
MARCFSLQTDTCRFWDIFQSPSSFSWIQGCKFLRAYNTFLVIVLQIIIACMMLMRICALYERRAWILVFSVILGICEVIIAASILQGGKYLKSFSVATVSHKMQFSIIVRTHYLVGGWAGVFVFDAVMFALTLYKTVTLLKGSGVGLLTMIMRDGTVYFGVVATLNLTNILVLALFFGPIVIDFLKFAASQSSKPWVHEHSHERHIIYYDDSLDVESP